MILETIIEIIEELFVTIKDIFRDIRQSFSKPADGSTPPPKEEKRKK